MSISSNFDNIKVKNNDNLYIVNEFIRYYNWIYSNYSKSNKSSKENYYKLLVIKKTIEIIANISKKIIYTINVHNRNNIYFTQQCVSSTLH